MRILVTNDDGIDSIGLHVLVPDRCANSMATTRSSWSLPIASSPAPAPHSEPSI